MFNNVDVGVLVMVLFSVGFGLLSGFVMQLASLLSLAAGVALSFFGGPYVSTALGRWMEHDGFRGFLAYTACFLLGSGLVRLVAAFLSALLKRWKLERFDRLAGGALGAAKGLALCAIVFVILGRFDVEGLSGPVRDSFSGGLIVAAADWTAAQVSGSTLSKRWEETAARARAKAEELQKSLRERAAAEAEKEIPSSPSPSSPDAAPPPPHQGNPSP